MSITHGNVKKILEDLREDGVIRYFVYTGDDRFEVILNNHQPMSNLTFDEVVIFRMGVLAERSYVLATGSRA